MSNDTPVTPPSRKLLGIRKLLSAKTLTSVPATVYNMSFMVRDNVSAVFIYMVVCIVIVT